MSALVNDLNAQTNKDFTVVIFNDGVEEPERWLSSLLLPYKLYSTRGSTPMDVRFEAFKKLRSLEFEYLIFQDSDDGLSPNRIEVVTELLANYLMVVNDLDCINELGQLLKKNIWKDRFMTQPVFNYSDLTSFNFAGLSNTAMHCKLLKLLPVKPAKEIIAVDWYLFYAMLYASKANGYRTSRCTTRYRQYSGNSIGQMSTEKSEFAKGVKKMHIEALRAANIPVSETEIKTEEPFIGGDSCANPYWWEIVN